MQRAHLLDGVSVEALAEDLVVSTPAVDICGFVALDGEEVVATIIFSRLTIEESRSSSSLSFLLSPVAVHTSYQGRGIGQGLIRFGLESLKTEGVKCVITYGDPGFYGKVGFRAISPDQVQPPFPLSQPLGWLGQNLVDADGIDSLKGKCRCVSAFNDPRYW